MVVNDVPKVIFNILSLFVCQLLKLQSVSTNLKWFCHLYQRPPVRTVRLCLHLSCWMHWPECFSDLPYWWTLAGLSQKATKVREHIVNYSRTKTKKPLTTIVNTCIHLVNCKTIIGEHLFQPQAVL